MLEEEKMWVCPKCGSIKAGWADDICSSCKCHVTITDMSWDQFVKLDPVEEQQWEQEITEKYVKLSPLFDPKAQDKRLTAELKENYESQHQVKCPTCQSTNIQKISGLERSASVAMLGLFSKKINKSFKCNHCGYTW